MSGKIALEASSVEAHPEFTPLVPLQGYAPREQGDSLFEQVGWLYIFCRENLFRDDTDCISAALWPQGQPPENQRMMELGCGPGFYSCRFARRFPQLSVVGVDRSAQQLAWARRRASRFGLKNCDFERGNVLDIPCGDSRYDALVASRLFTVLPEREEAIAEMHRVLKPGGRCFVAEPRRAFRASVPLFAMWTLARVTHFRNGYREPRKAVTLLAEEFRQLVATQPWRESKFWQDNRYQYALCEKA
ncbi:MAG TPA: class I SAM-dependent methyltransferase [Chthoniobacterales bacterium]|jgi:ubiquinone/menaquinone biosynthesis C-methylase UbiE